VRLGAVAALALCIVAGGLAGPYIRGDGGTPAQPSAPPLAPLAHPSGEVLFDLSGGAGQVAELQAQARLRPHDADAQADLGIAYLQRARETNDPSYYSKADAVLGRALQLQPSNVDAILGQGSVALSRHLFSKALALGEQAATTTRRFSPAALATIADSEIELGRYPQAFATVDRLGSVHPGLVAYSRQSYAQELQGDLAGAIHYMRLGVEAGSGSPENTQWTRVQLAGLLLKSGQIAAAETEYRHALAVIPNYARAEQGLGAVAVARGQLAAAERWYETASQHLPLPEIVVALGDVQTARGETAKAAQSYALVRAEQSLFTSAGGNADLELALFDANHPGSGGPTLAQAVALGRRAVAERPSVYGHDALAWALFKSGDCRGARSEAQRANALGTADPELSYHLGAIAACTGDRALARTALHRALARNPNFHPLDAPAARRLLAEVSR
jgi:tetratricopeptide (TPR) repeat protein